MKRSEPDYEVGYGKPPRSSRFRPGQSGNPKGRPKGSMNFMTSLERELRRRVVINENGKRKTITKLEAVAKQTVNKAASGDARAQAMLYGLLRSSDEANENYRTPLSALSETDQKVKEGILQRIRQAVEEVGDESDSV